MISFKEFLDENIKGWKNVHSDLMKSRQQDRDLKKEHKLVRLNKDGSERKTSEATFRFNSKEEALAHHKKMQDLNPNSKIKHHYYEGSELRDKLE